MKYYVDCLSNSVLEFRLCGWLLTTRFDLCLRLVIEICDRRGYMRTVVVGEKESTHHTLAPGNRTYMSSDVCYYLHVVVDKINTNVAKVC